MNDALVVRRFQSIADLFHDVESLVDRQGPSPNTVRERVTFDKFKNQKAHTLVVLKIVSDWPREM